MICPHCGKKMGKQKKENIGRCEAITERKWWNINIKNYDYRCKFQALKEINGKKLCGTHIRCLKQ